MDCQGLAVLDTERDNYCVKLFGTTNFFNSDFNIGMFLLLGRTENVNCSMRIEKQWFLLIGLVFDISDWISECTKYKFEIVNFFVIHSLLISFSYQTLWFTAPTTSKLSCFFFTTIVFDGGDRTLLILMTLNLLINVTFSDWFENKAFN